MPLDRSAQDLLGVGVGGLGAVILAAALVGVRDRLAPVNVALLLVVIVIGAAVAGGRVAGAFSALVASSSFGFFYARPYGTLKVGGANELITALLLLVVGLSVGGVAERSRRARARLLADQRELRRLHRVVTLAASGEEDERDLVLTVTAELLDALGLQACTFERPPFASPLPRLERDGTLAGRRRAVFTPEGFELPAGGVDLPVVGRTGTTGRFVLVPTPGVRVSSEALLVAVALAHELGLAFAAKTRPRRSGHAGRS